MVFEKTILEYTKQFSEKNNLGFIVGSNNLYNMIFVNRYSPGAILLIPGIGAQGGDLKALEYINKVYELNNLIIINSSRQIIFSKNPRDETIRLRDQTISYFENRRQ